MKNYNDIKESLLSIPLDSPLLRKLMSSDEIKVANKLVKKGLLEKGRSDDKQKTICFYPSKMNREPSVMNNIHNLFPEYDKVCIKLDNTTHIDDVMTILSIGYYFSYFNENKHLKSFNVDNGFKQKLIDNQFSQLVITEFLNTYIVDIENREPFIVRDKRINISPLSLIRRHKLNTLISKIETKNV